MDPALFERLLQEEESATLDFKRDQYRFAKASELEKSELLKDLLGFANAWRRSDAYILVGVEDVRGGRARVVGIQATEHLDDHSLQQFVNNLTNQPVRFHYEAFGFEGTQVGIFRIDSAHQRPVYLKKPYGALKPGEVYVRRGSSTDPTKPASPDEIAQMGSAPGPENAELTVEFSDTKRERPLGQSVAWDCELCAMPPADTIPDLAPPRRDVWGIDLSDISLTNRLNRDYFRELAEFEFAKRLFHPVRLVVANTGKVAANDVRVELAVPASVGALLLDQGDLPSAPQRRGLDLSPAVIGGMRSGFKEPGAVQIDKNEERLRVEMDCGDLQPGRRVWSDVFYVGKSTTGEIPAHGQIFAGNLPRPVDFSLTMTVHVTETQMSLEELKELPLPADQDD